MSVSTGVSKTRLVKFTSKSKPKPDLRPSSLLCLCHETLNGGQEVGSSLSHRGHVVCGGGGLWKRCHSLSGSDTARKPKESVSDGTRHTARHALSEAISISISPLRRVAIGAGGQITTVVVPPTYQKDSDTEPPESRETRTNIQLFILLLRALHVRGAHAKKASTTPQALDQQPREIPPIRRQQQQQQQQQQPQQQPQLLAYFLCPVMCHCLSLRAASVL
jgi:hypothetical protein